MKVNELLNELQSRNIQLWVEQGELKFKAPSGALDDAFLQHLRDHKQDLIEALCSQRGPDLAAISASVDESAISFSQQRLLFMSDTFGAAMAYNMPSMYQIEGELDVEKLRVSISNIVQQNEALRTSFIRDESGTYSACIHDQVLLLMELDDVSHLDNPQHESEQVEKAALEHVFDVSSAPLARFTLIKVAENRHRLVVNMHHVVSDGWSHQLLWKAIWQEYRGASNETAVASARYCEFVAWQKEWLASEQAEQQKLFWEKYLSGCPELIDLPLDFTRPVEPNYQGEVFHFSLPDSILQRLESFNQEMNNSDFLSLISAFYFMLNKYTGQTDICIGTPVANRRIQPWEDVIGCFANVVALRNVLEPTKSLKQLSQEIRSNIISALDHQDFPFEKVVEHLQPERSLSHSPLFQVMFLVEQDGQSDSPESLKINSVVPDLGTSKFDLTVTIKRNGDQLDAGIEYCTALFTQETIQRMAEHYCHVLEAMTSDASLTLANLQVFNEIERSSLLEQSTGPEIDFNPASTIHQQIIACADRYSDRQALSDEDNSLTYQQVISQAGSLASRLSEQGIKQGDRVGVSIERTSNMVIAMIGTMMSGAAYVPIDVNFPASRKQFICDDAELKLVLTSASSNEDFDRANLPTLCLDEFSDDTAQSVDVNFPKLSGNDVAYIIYTSGSTGKPKGVMVSHANAVNLFAGLSDSLSDSIEQVNGVPTFRALTSISFDISVLELFWTLSNGFHVIVERDHFSSLVEQRSSQARVPVSEKAKQLDFSLFYFASDQSEVEDPYHLLREGAKYADANNFSAVWMPERHFHSFGGQFPNPSVAAAAISSITENIEIRAGSVVIPLHHPIRVAEEWSMVDNLSGGRAAIAFASGWHFNDFVLAPDNFENRHQIFQESIETVRKLWSGESVAYTDGKGNPSDIRIFPKPKREQLPIWITSAANPETFKFAGSIGANVLTHFLGQGSSELAEKIALYRQARADNGYDPDEGKVTLMLHTFLSDDHEAAMAAVEKPFKAYLKNSINLLLPVAKSTGLDTEQDLEAVVEAGFQRYAKNSALFGTPESRIGLMNELADVDVNEIACLVDFGVDQPDVIVGFEQIGKLKKMLSEPTQSHTVDLHDRQATHIQCTPSYAQMLLESEHVQASLSGIKGFLVGGEPLTPSLSQQLNELTDGPVFNMYGPTETTVWSSVNQAIDDDVSIGNAIANTQLYVLDEQLEPVPNGIPGELFIAGDGVSYGYWNRPGLTAQNFIPNPFSSNPGDRLYRTGDMIKRFDDGRMLFLGRNDNQVKVRGYRIELDEIRDALEGYSGVSRAAVVVREGQDKEAAVHAFVLPQLPATSELVTQDIVTHLKTILPEYMVPSALFVLDELPYTANGKIDLKALPTDIVSTQRSKLVPAANETEKTIVSIWKALLKLENLGTQENFFELGGHSLLLAKLQTRLREECGVALEIIELFKYPTVASLASRIDSTHAAVPKKTISDRKQRNQSVNQIRNQMRQRNRRGK